MDKDKGAKVLEFLRNNQQRRLENPPDPSGLYFGVYPLHREDGVVLSMPLFELVLIRLDEGTAEGKQLAASLAETTQIKIPRPV